ncbi:hypothetical protein OAF74_03820 [bacterium]|jgi:Flp pilus assembly pilin Flp|nr:hypothetical protein [bacterium]MDB4731947.1 hypothetical protein [bacterium]
MMTIPGEIHADGTVFVLNQKVIYPERKRMLNKLNYFERLIRDESGNVQSTEYILIIVLLAIGGVVGLATLRDQVAQELADTGVALEQLDQSYVIATPAAGYDPTDPFDVALYDPMDPTTFNGFTISSYDNDHAGTPPPADPMNAAPAGMTFNTVAVGSEKVVGVSDGDSNN